MSGVMQKEKKEGKISFTSETVEFSTSSVVLCKEKTKKTFRT